MVAQNICARMKESVLFEGNNPICDCFRSKIKCPKLRSCVTISELQYMGHVKNKISIFKEEKDIKPKYCRYQYSF